MFLSFPDLPVRHFATLEELGELIIKDWVSVIDVYYPPISPLIFPNTDSEAWREWSAHESFAMNKCQVFVRTPRIREIVEVLNLHAEVRQGIKRKSTMLVPTAALNTFMTSLPDSDKETLPPVLVLAGIYTFYHFQLFDSEHIDSQTLAVLSLHEFGHISGAK